MRSSDLKRFVEDAVTEVLESMCFISSEGESTEDEEPCNANWICGELDFTGPSKGSFGIAVSPATAAIIAANFLGEDNSELVQDHMSEVLCELTNMICGTLLAHFDPTHAFTLSSPRAGGFEEHHPSNTERTYSVYSTDEGLVSTWLDIRGYA